MKKGQLKLIETIAIIIVLTIIFVLGFTIYNRQAEDKFLAKEAEYKALNLLEVGERVTNNELLSCVRNNVEDLACLDWYKIRAMKDHIENHSTTDILFFYRNVYGESKIEIRKIYPDTQTVLLYDQSKTEFTAKQLISIPVVIQDPLTKTRSLGLLDVTVTQ